MIKTIQHTLGYLLTLVTMTVICLGNHWITELPIPVMDEVDWPAEPFFISSGVPLAENTVQHVDELALLDATGKAIPTQYVPLAYWPDGSIKWVGLNPVLDGNVELPLSLYRQETNRSLPAGQVHVSQQGEVVTIDNGVVVVSIDGGQWSLQSARDGTVSRVHLELDRIRRPAQKVRSGWLDPREHTANDPVQTYSSVGGGVSVEVEESGPVRAVVRVKGAFHDQEDPAATFNQYDYRLFVYAGVSTVRWQASWIFDGDPAADSIGRLEAIVRSDVLSGGEAVAGVHREGTVETIAFDLAVVQDSVSEVRSGESVMEGQLAGWATVSADNNHSLSVAVRDFWQNYPSGFEFAGEELRVGLWPGESDFILDLARSSDGTGDGEHGADLAANAVGVGKTFDMLVAVNAGVESFASIANVFSLEPLFYPGSRYMTGTKVLGNIAYEDYSSFPRLEGFYRAATHWVMANRERFNWYGFIDFGDVRTNFLGGPREWRTQGRYGWRNGSSDVQQAFLMQYFRTGDPVAWQLGAPYARHVMDIDTVHVARPSGDQPVGAMHRRGQDHWSGSVQSQYTYSQGAFLYHYLSGDPRVRSVLLEEVAPWQSEPGPAGSANAANTVVRAWEATGDPHWLEVSRRQMDRHLNETTYDNFRFASDYVQALLQYTRLTDDERGHDTVAKRAEKLLDAESWAYFHPGIDRRGGRMALLGEMYHQTGDKVKYIEYPSRLLADVLPSLPPEEATWDFDKLTDYVRSAGLSATTQLGELGRGPYYLSALQEAGWSERHVRSQPALYGTLAGRRLSGTYADVGQSREEYDNQWQFIDLPAVQSCEDAAQRVAGRIRGLPAGGVLEVNNIPFKLAPRKTQTEGGILFLCDGAEVTVPVPPQTEALYLLGPMIEIGDWREGQEVIEYTLHLRSGEKRKGVWKNLIDLNDYRGFHYARNATPGRFWQIGNQNRVHAYVVELDFAGEDVASVTLSDSGSGYDSFVLSATAKLKQPEDKQVFRRVIFAEKDAQNTETQTIVFTPDMPSAEQANSGAAWLLSAAAIEGLRFSEEGVTTEEAVALQVPLANGEYLVGLKMAATTILGGVVEIGVSGNGLGVVAISGSAGDWIQVPALVEDGMLKVWAQSIPALHSTSNQRADWRLESIEVIPLPEGEWFFHPELQMEIIRGTPLGEHANLEQSVGAQSQYSFWSMDKVLTASSRYQIENPKYPQDIIFSFDEPITLTGVLFSAMNGYGPRHLTLQVRRPGDNQWHTIKEWELEAESTGVREAVPAEQVTAARLLMNGGYSRELRILRADVYGIQ